MLSRVTGLLVRIRLPRRELLRLPRVIPRLLPRMTRLVAGVLSRRAKLPLPRLTRVVARLLTGRTN